MKLISDRLTEKILRKGEGMSQTLMPGERDLGGNVSFEPQVKNIRFIILNWTPDFFNGQGASGTTDFDSHKDFISRLTIKPYFFKNIELSGGLSFLTWRLEKWNQICLQK